MDTMTKYSENDVKEIAIQAAYFSNCCSHVMSDIDMDDVNGISGIFEICAEQAIIFCDHYRLAEKNDEYFWDSNDWYILSDQWFSDQIQQLIMPSRGNK
jgi:hypothetical protein